MKSKKVKFLLAILMIFNIAAIVAQCDSITAYYQIDPSNPLSQWETAGNGIDIQVEVGTDIKFGPQPNIGGTWSWNGCGVSGLTDREYTITMPSGGCEITVSFTASGCETVEYTFKLVEPACNPSPITPFYNINSQGWLTASENIDVLEGDSILFGPQTSGGGTWSWSGCGVSGVTSREHFITVGASNCSITATYTNNCGEISTFTYNLIAGVQPCVAATVSPYYQVSGRVQTLGTGVDTDIVAEEGTLIDFTPTANQEGVWSWSGCGASNLTTDTYNLTMPSSNCSIVATFTNQCDTDTFVDTHTFNITVGVPQTLDITIPATDYQIDDSRNIILSRIENIEIYDNLSTYQGIVIMFGTTQYNFVTLPDNLSYTDSYIVSNESDKEFKLYFTKLPIIAINTSSESIPDEPKILASFSYKDESQTMTDAYIGIEKRGGISQGYPKNTYDIEFWEDTNGDNSVNAQFGDLRNDDDWVLDALYNEPLRMRAYTAHKLWLDMHSLYYLEDEDKAKSGADVMFVEMFLNGNYNGVYLFSEQVDKKQLQLKSFKNGERRGELYKGVDWENRATTFTDLPDYNNNSRYWSGHDMKYPKDDEMTDWNNLYNFTNFVMNSSDSDFENDIWNQFHYDNYIDYFIYLNLLRAGDNIGKNIYVAKYKVDEPYFYVPWDLDGVFGTNWEGVNDNTFNDILGNNFHKRVIDLDVSSYTEDVKKRWADLRDKSVLINGSLEARMLEGYNYLKESNVYEREALVFPNYDFDQDSFEYMLDWTEARIAYLDSYFDYIPSLGISENVKNKIYPFPNPTSNIIYINNANQLENKNYTIYDIVGKVVKKGILLESKIIVSDISTGLYLLRIQGNTYRIILE